MEEELMEESSGQKETFRGTVQQLKKKAAESNVIVTHAQIAGKLNIPLEQFNACYISDEAPPELFPLLRSQYSDIIGNLRVIHIWFTETIELPDPEFDEE
ncbi:hypothetical protein [Chitinophaga polysaccharea]|uniref:hypothetical protein n=1 Tax=Chitinophaga polysaccharea TaxID=1293035 RepID=UPI001157A867|nr:hypothetical protein [Chitinophaga polysaccharea]